MGTTNQYAKRTAQAQLRSQDMAKRIKSGMILKKLQDHLAGKIDLTSTQVETAKLLLSKTMPALQSIEQTNTEQEINPDQVQSQLQAMLSNPSILSAILADSGLRAQLKAALDGVPSPVVIQDNTIKAA